MCDLCSRWIVFSYEHELRSDSTGAGDPMVAMVAACEVILTHPCFLCFVWRF